MRPENDDQGDSLPLTVAMRIDQVCMEFEAAWQSGPAPRLEDFLGTAEGPELEELLRQLLRLDLELHGHRGSVPAIEEYLARIPGHESLIREEVEEVESLAAPDENQPQPEDTLRMGGVEAAANTMAFSEVGIPGFEIRRRLGRGGMGIVYEALQVKPRRLVALKVVRGGADADPEELRRFRDEAESAARLQHPNIAQIFEVGEHNGLPWFSMELCGAGSLDHYLLGGPLTPAAAAALVETLARAMHYAHQEKIIHRDLKPANILLSPPHAAGDETGTAAASAEGERLPLSSLLPKVGDFGLARKLDTGGQTRTGAIMGTPSYMAPEQASGRNNELGPACDTYALGAILYECLTGRPPFKAATVMDTILQVISDEPVPPAQLNARVPRDLETICLKCLEKDPGKRYDSALSLAEDLGRCQRGEPIRARPVGRLECGWRWCKRNPAVAALLATVLLVLATGATVSSVLALLATEARGEAEQAAANAKQEKAAAEAARNDLEKANTALLESIDNLVTSVARGLLRPLAV